MAEQPPLVAANQQVLAQPPFNMAAVTGQIRYQAPPEARYGGDPRWVELDWLYYSKRRFQSVDVEEFRRLIQAEHDRNVPRFLMFFERGTGMWWVRTNDIAERRNTRRAG